jgi:hypothetical protein
MNNQHTAAWLTMRWMLPDCFSFVCLCGGGGVELRASPLQARCSASPVLCWVFSRYGLENYLPGAGFEL